eukprot:2093122-Rhodomonas_salina.2
MTKFHYEILPDLENGGTTSNVPFFAACAFVPGRNSYPGTRYPGRNSYGACATGMGSSGNSGLQVVADNGGPLLAMRRCPYHHMATGASAVARVRNSKVIFVDIYGYTARTLLRGVRLGHGLKPPIACGRVTIWRSKHLREQEEEKKPRRFYLQWIVVACEEADVIAVGK